MTDDRTANMAPSRFTSAVCLVAIVGCLIVAVGPLLLGAPAAFHGSVVASALFGAVFAGYNAYSMRTYGQPRLAAGFITTVFGLWFVGAPLVYTVPARRVADRVLYGLRR